MKYDITPIPAPRMTQSDKWKKRACVLKYRAFRDEVRLKIRELPERFHVNFYFPFPKSYSASKRRDLMLKPHLVKPDADNCLKALLDALYENDSHVWDVRVTKRWAEKGCIEICPL